MGLKKYIHILVISLALFSMFFGGGNLTFPLWIAIGSSSLISTTLGFITSAVLLPFYGVIIGLYFKGDYNKFLNVWGKPIGAILIFSLLFFWIPLGSGPRCNQLAFGAYTQMGWKLPLWLHSIIYSGIVYLIAYRKNRILGILGNILTPGLLFFLFSFIYLGFKNMDAISPTLTQINWNNYLPAFSAGYFTMDFIAAIFFTSTIITLVKEKQKERFQLKPIYYACLIAIILLSIVYLGMIFIGHINAGILQNVGRDQLLIALGKAVFHESFHMLIFFLITLGCLTTSVALAFVFSEYMKVTIFKNRFSHKICLGISVLFSFMFSIIGFEPLAVIISFAMSILYPFLLLTTTTALVLQLAKNILIKVRKGKAAKLLSDN